MTIKKRIKHKLGKCFHHLAVLCDDQSHKDSQRHIQQLQILRTIDQAIISGKGIQSIHSKFSNQLVTSLGADSVCVLSINANSQKLELQSRECITLENNYFSEVKSVENAAWKSINEKKIIHLDKFTPQPIECYCVPLIVKGKVKGVLEIFKYKNMETEENLFHFLETLATQGAIAIEFEESVSALKNANQEMEMAYDSTLKGWANALELRDNETEGHCQRVVDKTMFLAAIMGIRGEKLIQMRRGALLHDIGKIGIPDKILNKPGPLDDEEWKIVQKHPLWARDLLSKIPYLKNTLDIPTYHHEKWDGTGYPFGLFGEHIPLPARIFAIADVWDALRSDRPYRKAWQEKEVIKYIKDQSGKQFDPEIVDVFIKALEGEVLTNIASEENKVGHK
ncbi:MAG: HD domain-containing protein [Anaerolineaceae bacterium]|nr:HD domain-containing protein [Anaerolineaceae bacterium]